MLVERLLVQEELDARQFVGSLSHGLCDVCRSHFGSTGRRFAASHGNVIGLCCGGQLLGAEMEEAAYQVVLVAGSFLLSPDC